VGSRAREAASGTSKAGEGLLAVVYGSVASAALAAFTATRVGAQEVTQFFRVGPNAVSGYDMSFSLALLGAGTSSAFPSAWPCSSGCSSPGPGPCRY
jgi:hypothetical protein